jgi:hypothetical protein
VLAGVPAHYSLTTDKQLLVGLGDCIANIRRNLSADLVPEPSGATAGCKRFAIARRFEVQTAVSKKRCNSYCCYNYRYCCFHFSPPFCYKGPSGNRTIGVSRKQLSLALPVSRDVSDRAAVLGVPVAADAPIKKLALAVLLILRDAANTHALSTVRVVRFADFNFHCDLLGAQPFM